MIRAWNNDNDLFQNFKQYLLLKNFVIYQNRVKSFHEFKK